jgi:hypothetical protein
LLLKIDLYFLEIAKVLRAMLLTTVSEDRFLIKIGTSFSPYTFSVTLFAVGTRHIYVGYYF